jgi:pyruvate/2-oxoglutarate dehydrogenase complex dihydrolipoamide acyltransferase (E2) component
MGKAVKKPVVIDDKIEIRTMMSTVWTIDHRFGDAAIGYNIIKIVKDYTEDPENFNIEKYPDYQAYKPRV